MPLPVQDETNGSSDAEWFADRKEEADVEDEDEDKDKSGEGEDGDERILMLSGSGLEVGTRESGEWRKRRSFARRPEVGSRVKAQ